MTLENQQVKEIIKRLITGQDYRIIIHNLINSKFLQSAIDFFKKVIEAKLGNQNISMDWYKAAFLNSDLSSNEIANNAGWNKKTIMNINHTAAKEKVIEVSHKHYDQLFQSINNLIENQSEIDLTLTIKLSGVSIELNMNESLVVINALAVKRAALRGGAWSTEGKQVEKPLMETLCKLYAVPSEHFDQGNAPKSKSMREVDFYLINEGKTYKCEVKLMGKGNPESGDAPLARKSDIFVADTLSDTNKKQAAKHGIKWVALQDENGYRKFATILQQLGIPHKDFTGDLDTRLNEILDTIIKN